MTHAATLSTTACVVEILVGLLALAFSRAPGWRHLRVFSAVAFTASLYSLSSIPQSLGAPAATIVWAGRLSFFAAALQLASWIAYSATPPGGRPRLGRVDRAWIAVAALVAVLAPIPGALTADAVRLHDVAWLGLRYATAEATLLGMAAFPLLLAGMVAPAVRYVRRSRAGVPGATAHAVGFVVLLLTGAFEALVGGGFVDGPYLLDLGFLAAVVAIVGEMSRQVTAEARSLAESSARLERQVEDRTEALRRSEDRFRRLLGGMTDAYAAISMDGRIVEANEAFRRLVGYSAEELERLTWRDLTPERWREAEERILADQVLPLGSSEVFEKEYRRKDGTVFPVELRIFLIRGADGAPEGAWAIVRDITARKEAEAERERLRERILESQRLESIGRLAGGVAHEFNNLLTVILATSETLAQDLRAGSSPAEQDLEQIQAAALRARDVTAQLLAFARRQLVSPVVFDLNELLRSSVPLLERLVGEDVALRLDLAGGLWPIHCDPTQVEQVVLHLASNARDAMPVGGVLSVETHNVPGGFPPAGEEAGRDRVQLIFRDTGAGMTPDVLARVFEPFFTTKDPGHGIGLGLAMVYGIVEQGGGTIRADSTPGRGTEFRIEFPRAEALPGGQAAGPAPAPGGGGETVLVVEDEPLVREVTHRVLERSGFRVMAAADAAEALALEAAHAGPIHLLITDVVMPGQDGKALADELRRRRPSLKVLFVSGYPRDVIGRRGILDEGIAFLPKPFRPATLLERVRAVLDGMA